MSSLAAMGNQARLRLADGCACGGSAPCTACASAASGRLPHGSAPGVPPVALEATKSGGRSLAPDDRAHFEQLLDADLSRVRLHDEPRAHRAAAAVNAVAYTVGQDVVFGAGAYAPHRPEGRRLLAHELAHTVQQRNASAPSAIGWSDAGAERVAETAGSGTQVQQPARPLAVAREVDAGVGGLPDEPGGERYGRQSACVSRLGGHTTTRPGGLPSPDELARYNTECRSETGYEGPDITPSDEEARQYRTGEILDPDKVQRLVELTTRYEVMVATNQLRADDALIIDRALRRAHAAMNRAGMGLPPLPEESDIPAGTRLDVPVLAVAPVGGFLATGATTTTTTTGILATEALAGGAAATEATVAGGALVTEATVAGGTTAAAGGTTAAAGTAAGVGLGTAIAGVVIGVAVVVGIGVLVYYLVTLEDPDVDPIAPQELDDAIDTIQRTLDNPRPLVPDTDIEPDTGTEETTDVGPSPDTTPDSDEERRRRRRLPPVDVYHGTSEPDAWSIASGTPVLAIGHGEFGQGFYTFRDQAAAERVGADYTRRRGGASWGVVDFRIPVRVLVEYGLSELLAGEGVLVFPDRTTPVPVRYPDYLGGVEISMSWTEFRDENREQRRVTGIDVSWPYDLIIGPLSGRLSGFPRNLEQFVFNNAGVIMLNDPRVTRDVTSTGLV